MKALRWLENATFRLDFASIAFHKIVMLLIFHAEYAKIVLHSFLSSVYYGAIEAGPEKIFKMNVLSRLENGTLRSGFANTLNASFNYAFFSTAVQALSSFQLFKNYLTLTMHVT